MLYKSLFLLFTVLLQHNYINTMAIDQIIQHKQIHPQNKQYLCITCNKKFCRPWNLQQHERIHSKQKSSNSPIKSYHCTECNKSFADQYLLTEHTLKHSEEKKHYCIICNKGFSRPSYLRNHERTHSGERPYLCTICNKTFDRSSTLTRHRKTHLTHKEKQITPKIEPLFENDDIYISYITT